MIYFKIILLFELVSIDFGGLADFTAVQLLSNYATHYMFYFKACILAKFLN